MREGPKQIVGRPDGIEGAEEGIGLDTGEPLVPEGPYGEGEKCPQQADGGESQDGRANSAGAARGRHSCEGLSPPLRSGWGQPHAQNLGTVDCSRLAEVLRARLQHLHRQSGGLRHR